MRKALVIGATGMLGHKALQIFAEAFEVAGTVRQAASRYRETPALAKYHLYGEVSAAAPVTVTDTIRAFEPDLVLNCAAVTASRIPATDKPTVRRINSDLPHAIARACQIQGCRLIHISTDAVFSGKRGGYRETDQPDPIDFYGETKRDGEPTGAGSLTVRTSHFGRQLFGRDGLVEWLRSEAGNAVSGFQNAAFSGLPTVALCRLLREVAAARTALDGVVHIGSPAISKYELLTKLNRALNLGIRIEPAATPVIDRSLDSSHFKRATGLPIPDWPDLIEAFVADARSTAYQEGDRTSRQSSNPT